MLAPSGAQCSERQAMGCHEVATWMKSRMPEPSRRGIGRVAENLDVVNACRVLPRRRLQQVRGAGCRLPGPPERIASGDVEIAQDGIGQAMRGGRVLQHPPLISLDLP